MAEGELMIWARGAKSKPKWGISIPPLHRLHGYNVGKYELKSSFDRLHNRLQTVTRPVTKSVAGKVIHLSLNPPFHNIKVDLHFIEYKMNLQLNIIYGIGGNTVD